VSSAIATFIKQYQSEHQSLSLVVRQLEETEPFEAGDGLYYGALKLKFSHLTDGRYIFTSVFIKVAAFAEWYSTGTKMLHYDKENYMYQTVLPTMYLICPNKKLWPNFYGSTQKGVMIVENIRETGFYTNEYLHVGLEECVHVFKSLARFHALSVDVLQLYSTSLDALTIMDRTDFISGDKYLHTMLRKYKKHVIPLIPEIMRRELESMANNIVFVLNTAYLPDAHGLNIILHGNVTRTNVFYQNDSENNVIGCKFVNFINSRRGSPVIDLMNFLITSARFEVFELRGFMLFDIYLSEFRATREHLKDFDSNQYNLHDLRADLRKYRLLFVYELTFYAPLFWTLYADYNTDDKEDDYDTLLKSEEFIVFFVNWMRVFLSW
jgi:hypothetical protein